MFLFLFFFQDGSTNLSQRVHLGARFCSVIWKKVGYTGTQDREAIANLFEGRHTEITGQMQKLIILLLM